jgi:hypothetical protein
MNKLDNYPLLISKIKIKNINNNILKLLNEFGNDLIINRINSFLFTNNYMKKKFKNLNLNLNEKINNENDLIIKIWKYLHKKNKYYYKIILNSNFIIYKIRLNKPKFLLNDYIRRKKNINNIINTALFYNWKDVIIFLINNYNLKKKDYFKLNRDSIDKRILKLLNLKKINQKVDILDYIIKFNKFTDNIDYDLKMKLFLKNRKGIDIKNLKDYIK